MINWLTRLFNRIRYGKPITESYVGKVVRVKFGFHGCHGWGWLSALITVLQDDGSGFIAGPLLSANWTNSSFLAGDGLHHARKTDVEVVANNMWAWQQAQGIKQTRKKWLESVCSNKAGTVGIVRLRWQHLLWQDFRRALLGFNRPYTSR